ncbi:uncharacterized protein BDZ99DRAFT_469287 [Mytilinidion resinicola]|uniref:Uncharacterized protein n=1 Tax=Mytilinidion resinicola TaxID=574789 RepID=A0A6A6Y2G8_9PEZI|nr:uncharacterized protein BDZ99DRAFT_469287 [Mytilinidion resinicola]KAF2802007.1 hypothetical protein BDZ99DRAFT_469287 [Mytilinidion resinicola]
MLRLFAILSSVASDFSALGRETALSGCEMLDDAVRSLTPASAFLPKSLAGRTALQLASCPAPSHYAATWCCRAPPAHAASGPSISRPTAFLIRAHLAST